MIEVEHWVPTKQEAWESRPNVMGAYGICRYCMATAPERCGCEEVDPLADSLGIPPERLDNGRCGCDRPRWKIRPCGHCACECECNDCPANKLWRDEQESWCGCWRPGDEGVLPCGHCSCGYGCFEVVRGNSHAPMQKVPCVT